MFGLPRNVCGWPQMFGSKSLYLSLYLLAANFLDSNILWLAKSFLFNPEITVIFMVGFMLLMT